MGLIIIVGSEGYISTHLKNTFLKMQLEFIGLPDSKSVAKLPISILEQCTHIVWAAARVNPTTADSNPEKVQTELAEFHKFIGEVSENRSLRDVTILFLSSAGCTYQDSDLPFSENSAAKGTNAYGVLKLDMELLLKQVVRNWCVLRISNVYGPASQQRQPFGVINAWLNAIAVGEQIKIFGDSSSTRDYLYIDDLCRAIVALVKKNSLGTYNIGSGIGTTLSELIQSIRQVTNIDFNVIHANRRFTDKGNYYLDISKIKLETGWAPETNLQVGISHSWDSKVGAKKFNRP